MSSDEPLANYIRRYKEVYEDASHPPGNKLIFDRYLKEGGTNKLSEDTLKQRYEVLTFFSKWCIIPLEKITDLDIADFLDKLSDYKYKRKGSDVEYKYSIYTIQTYRIILKQFFASAHFVPVPDIPPGITVTLSDMERLQAKTRTSILDTIKIYKQSELEAAAARAGHEDKEALTEVEIQDMITCTQNDRDAMMVAVLYEAGCRKGEFRSCRVKHAKIERDLCRLTFPKTKGKGARTVELVFSRMYIQNWILKHPQKLANGLTDPEAFLLISLQNPKMVDGRPIYSQLTTWGIAKQIKAAAERAGVTKAINPHNFRATRATHLATQPDWTEQRIKQFQGWSKDSHMLKRYIKDIDTEDAVRKTYGLPVESGDKHVLRVVICPSCHQPQPESMRDIAQRCYSCGSPLTEAARAEEMEASRRALMALIDAAHDDPHLLDLLAQLAKKEKQ